MAKSSMKDDLEAMAASGVKIKTGKGKKSKLARPAC